MLTFTDLGLAGSPGLKLVEGIHHGQNLHSTYCGEHVGIVTWGGSKSAVLMLARKHKVDRLAARKSVRLLQKVKGRETPIHPVETQMFRQPIVQLVFPRVEALDIFDMSVCSER